jgi:hypothetical protein
MLTSAAPVGAFPRTAKRQRRMDRMLWQYPAIMRDTKPAHGEALRP